MYFSIYNGFIGAELHHKWRSTKLANLSPIRVSGILHLSEGRESGTELRRHYSQDLRGQHTAYLRENGESATFSL